MQTIETGRLVVAWERGQKQHPLHRALTLLQSVDPEQTIDGLASLTVGERDRRLIEMRRRLFGSSFDAFATCPRCEEKLELRFGADQLPLGAQPPACIELTAGNRRITVRLPNTADLLDVAAEAPERRESFLLERCAGTELPPDAAEALQSQMAEMDPMTLVSMDLTCPGCEHQWSGVFDIASYLWTELSDYVVRLFRETHSLARAYGWSEADILSMTPRRRQVYLDMVMGS